MSAPASSSIEESGPPDETELDAVIARAQEVLLRSQATDGAWTVACDMGPIGTAQVLVALRFIDRLDEGDAGAAVRHLLRQQRSDGSFVIHPFAPAGDPGATACVWAGLRAAGLADDAEPVRRARAYVEANGGLDPIVARIGMGDPTGLFLAMAGVVPSGGLEDPPHAFAVIPGLDKFIERRFNLAIPFTLLLSGVLIHHLRGERRRGPWAAFEARRCLALLDRFQNADGSWLWDDSLHVAMILPVLRALGVPASDRRFSGAVAWLEGQRVREGDGLWWAIFRTDVWPTAFCLRALLASGLPARHPAVERAVGWIVGAQVAAGGTDTAVPPPGAPRAAWAFSIRNTALPDCDDTAVCLGPLAMWLGEAAATPLPEPLAAQARGAVERGYGWLMGRQNPDGGWASFQWGLPSKPRGPIMTGALPTPSGLVAMARFFLNPPAELGDPATEDVTGRVLHSFGPHGIGRDAPPVRQALAFLQRQQCESGAFWGRWVVNYLAATAWVVRGLASAGVDLRAPWIQRALAFLRDRQNADGGFGEEAASYRSEAAAGIGPSTAALTGLVLAALVEADEGGSDAAARAAAYLLREQRGDGSWPAREHLHALLPPSLFYVLPLTEQQQPLEGLGLYRAFRQHRLRVGLPPGSSQVAAERARELTLVPPGVAPPPRTARGAWNPLYLAAMKQTGDRVADDVVAEIFAAGQVPAIADLIAKIARSDDPVPAGLPERTRRYFDETADLPSWADPALVADGQALFVRCGWAISTVLFCSSLPQLYAFPDGARVLLYSQGIPRHAWRRMIETAQFVMDVAAPGGLAADARGRRSAQKVRLMHAAVRRLVLAQGSWDSRWGVPINQQHLAGTLMTFSTVVLDGLDRIGLEVTEREARGWMHLWLVVGHALGLEPDLLPRDKRDGEALFDEVKRTGWAPSPAGAELAQATLALMRELLPGTHFDGLPVALVRHLAGEHCADLLGLPRADWTLLVARALCSLADALEGDDLPAQIGSLVQHVSFETMKALAVVSRDGKQVGFRMPEALIRAWQG